MRTMFRSLMTALWVLLSASGAHALSVGDPAPPFKAPSTRGEVDLAMLTEQGPVVLAFYFADFTPV